MKRSEADHTRRQEARFETRLRQVRSFDALPLNGRVSGPVVDLLFGWSPTTRWRRREAGLLPSPEAGTFYTKRQLLPLLNLHFATHVHRMEESSGSDDDCGQDGVDLRAGVQRVDGAVDLVAIRRSG